jgi:hypothetical protein
MGARIRRLGRVRWRDHAEASTTSLVQTPRSRYMVPRSWHKLRSFKGQLMNQAAHKQDRERGSREHRTCIWLNSFGNLPSRTQAIFSSGRDYYIDPPTHENRLSPLQINAHLDRLARSRGDNPSQDKIQPRGGGKQLERTQHPPRTTPPAAIKWSQARSAAEPIAVRRISVRPSPHRSRVPSIRSLYSDPTHLRETPEERNRPTDGYTR